ncbi:YtfJ family protein [Sediminitomix flava]|uniref:Uncharacterized protein n=1 Tax=Sediminitomix flava TaxID=379075 RepID=A0A315ZVC5_SEDFL|nr:YtfJ family protein [Sediminitomix flava]PWJ40159.1 hypothetical protein BC781_105227 [Sediminitomix flava]
MLTNKFYLPTLLLLFAVNLGFSQEKKTVEVGDKIENVKIRDSKDKPVDIPFFGEKVLMVYYSDPDKPSRNSFLTERMKEEELNGEDFYGFGIVNLKDAPFFPNGVVRFMIRQEEKKNAKHNVKIYTDPDHILKKAWNLGDVNDQFAIIVVSKEGEVLFYQEEELSEPQTERFITWLKGYLEQDKSNSATISTQQKNTNKTKKGA